MTEYDPNYMTAISISEEELTNRVRQIIAPMASGDKTVSELIVDMAMYILVLEKTIEELVINGAEPEREFEERTGQD